MPASADLKYLIACTIILVLWTSFNILFVGAELSYYPLPNIDNNSFVGLMVATVSFLNPFSTYFRSDYFLINLFIFGVLGFGVIITGARFVRG